MLKVPFAKDWTNRHIENTNSGFLHDVHNQPIAATAANNTDSVSVFVSTPTKSVETTDGSTEISKHESKAGGSVESGVQEKNMAETEHVFQKVTISSQSKPYDWTLSSDYCCTLSTEEEGNTDHSSTSYTHNSDPGKKVLSARKLSEQFANFASRNDNSSSAIYSSNSGIQIAPATASSIELDLLRDRDAPILFYDEFILYQVSSPAACICS